MTVVHTPAIDLPSLPPEDFDCSWFEGKRHHQKSFPADALEAAPNETGLNVSALLEVVEAIRAKRDGGASKGNRSPRRP
jgi:hypothetical protein